MFKSKYTFTFILTVFFLLSITGAGIFLDDEWVSTQQLRQLGEGHQIVTNEGGYGYYENGTRGNYFDYRSNILMYSLALPIISLPIYGSMIFFEDLFRLMILGLWVFAAFYILYYLNSYKNKPKSIKYFAISLIILNILMLINIFLYQPFLTGNQLYPSEILAITLTNIILMGIFAVILHKIIDILFDDNNRLKIFAFITTMSCTSLLFWSGTCKDHIISALTGLIIIYYLIKYEKYKSMTSLALALFLAGLLTWIRIEYGLGLIIGMGVYLLIFHYRDIISNFTILALSFLTGTIPLWINNYITTGSPFVHPFTQAIWGFEAGISYEEKSVINATMLELSNNIPVAIFKLLLSPGSGALGLIILIPLITIVITAYILKRVKLSQTDILLLILSFSSIIYYTVIGSVFMGSDTGIVPDIRYFVVFYTPITLFAISVLSKILPDLNYKKMIMYYILAVGLLIILFTAYSVTISDGGYRDLNRIVNTLTTIMMGIGIIAVINDIRLNKKYLTYVLPIMIAIPMAWQLVMIFIFHTSKAQSYPMFIPISEFIYNYLFGLIIW